MTAEHSEMTVEEPAGQDAQPEPTPAAAPEWPELEITPAAAARSAVQRPVLIAIAALLLAIEGVGGIVTAFLTPFLPEALANVAPVLAGLLGLGAVVAAVGAWRLEEWGRLVGLGVALGWLIRDALLTQTAIALGLDPLLGRAPNPFFDWVLPLGLDLIVLVALTVGWRRIDRQG